MKVIKPLRLAILHRTFERESKFYLAVTVGAFFAFEQPDRLLPEVAMWKLAATEFGKDFALDMGMPKRCAEILVKGSCFADGASPRKGKEVRLTSGPINKALWVFGNRRWVRGATGASPSDPEPFTEMAVSWSNAYGGPDYPENPLGKGSVPTQMPNGEQVHFLPNIEDPKSLLATPDDRVMPAGFGPYDTSWPQRFSKIGTYDEAWLRERFPWYARDLDWGYFNVAPADQQLDGYFKAGQDFEVAGMHPTKAVLRSRLPQITVRCFINQKTAAGTDFRELKSVPETLWLFPHAERAILLFRACGEIATDDAFDVLQLVVGADSPSAPRGTQHYQDVLKTRLDREKGYRFLLRDDQLMPPPLPPSPPLPEEEDEMGPLVTPSGIMQKRMRAQAEKQLAQVKANAQAQHEEAIRKHQEMGLPPPDLSELDQILSQELPPEKEIKGLADVDFDELDRMAEEGQQRLNELEADLTAKRQEAENRAREQLKSQGLDFDAIVAERSQKVGPPRFDAKAELARMRAMREQMQAHGVTNPDVDRILADPNLEKRMYEIEKNLDQSYRKYAHYFPEAPAPNRDEIDRLRAEVIAAHGRGEKLNGKNLAGVDLSGLSLKNADLHDAILEGANLSDADLSGSDLKGAVLARAKLLKAKLVKSNLAEANLGKANLEGADLSGSDLKGATLTEAILTSANLSGTNLEGADTMDAKLSRVNLAGAMVPGLRLIKADLTGANCSGAAMKQAIFYECKMDGIDFSEADLEGTSLITIKGKQLNFARAKLRNMRTGLETSFANVNFEGADLRESNFREVNFEQANLAGAQLDGADFSVANLRNADLRQIAAKAVRMVRTDLSGAKLDGADLFEAVLQKALLTGASFKGANLYRADTLRVTVDQKTDLQGANLQRTLLQEWKK